MALSNQPYIPLYIDDYLTDEKLNECSAATQGIYIKLICLMHKSKEYGRIFLKEKYLNSDLFDLNNTKHVARYFALQLEKQLTFPIKTLTASMYELIQENVISFDGKCIYQRRMIRDNDISIKRSTSAKKGGGNPVFVKTKLQTNIQTKPKQNTVYVNDIVDNNNLVNDSIEQTSLENTLSENTKLESDKFVKDKKVTTFAKPNIGEIKDYCSERKNNIDSETFFDFYESKGWRIGNQPMKNWKAAIRTWEKNNGNNGTNHTRTISTTTTQIARLCVGKKDYGKAEI